MRVKVSRNNNQNYIIEHLAQQNSIAFWGYTIVLMALPFFLCLVNPIWLNNSLGDLDNWMYYGYFNHLYQFANRFIWVQNAYIGTRIPYILPGYIIHGFFGDKLYKYAFNIGIIYNTIVFSYFYILRRFYPVNVAAAITVLIALDFYFLRSIGWDYVDKCVAAYEALTFLFLTMAGRSKCPRLSIAVSGFCAASMLFVHIASVLLFPIFYLFFILVIKESVSRRDWLLNSINLAIFGATGAMFAQLIFGSLTMILGGGDFFFFLKQINSVAPNVGGWNTPIFLLMKNGYWIVPHLAALIGSILALLSRPFKLDDFPLTRFEAFWLCTAAVGYSLLFYCEWKGYLWLFSRDGVHSTIFIPFAMVAWAILLFRDPPRNVFFMTTLFSVATVILRLSIGSGRGLSDYLTISVPVLGLASGCVLALAFVSTRIKATIPALAILGLLGSFNSWSFADDGPIRDIHARIDQAASHDFPHIFFDQKDPKIYLIHGILGTFTDRALVPQGWSKSFPDLSDDKLAQGDTIVVLSGIENDDDRIRSALLKTVPHVASKESFMIDNLWVHIFTVSQN